MTKEENKQVIELIDNYIKAPYKIRVLEVEQEYIFKNNGRYNKHKHNKIKELKKYINFIENIVPIEVLTRENIEEFKTSRPTKNLQIKNEFLKVLDKINAGLDLN